MRSDDSDSLSDDDDDSTFGARHKPEQGTKKWDVFQEAPPSEDAGSMANQDCFNLLIKITKVFAYVTTFMIVLGSAVISKGTLLFMTSQLQVNSSSPLYYCDLTDKTRQYEVQIPAIERVAWQWCLLFALIFPEVMTLLRSLRICVFKSFEKPLLFDFCLVMTIELLHTFGIVLLVFVILPDLDVIKGVMLTNCMCFVPGLLGLISRPNSGKPKSRRHSLNLFMDWLALLAQVTGFIVWPLIEDNKPTLWYIPLSVFCISCAWWENYITVPMRPTWGFLQSLCRLLFRLKDPRFRYFTYFFASIWKMFWYFAFMIIFTYSNDGDPQKGYFNLMFENFSTAFNPRTISIIEIAYVDPELPNLGNTVPNGDPEAIAAWHNASLYVLLIHVICTYICYVSGRFACKILIQNLGYAFPLNLTVPVTVSLLIALCGMRNADPCVFLDVIPRYLFFSSPPFLSLSDYIGQQHVWVWFLWLLSQAWITKHIWYPNNETLAATDKLFVLPMYDTFLIDQSLALNRRRDKKIWDVTVEDLENLADPHDFDLERRQSMHSAAMSNSDFASKMESSKVKPSDRVTRIYACATMWHETSDEMLVMLLSVLRMDNDQSARRNLQKYLDMVDDNYYEFQTHIFFDDAFETEPKDKERIVNRFVKDLIVCLEEAVFKLHRSYIQPPTKIPTPYGGRLVWTLPGNTKLVVHLKDKDKIRHRKRWSQVMYMYYLLGHRLMELPIHVDRKALIAQNTYLLALDGDIDFRPHAVRLLIDLMKKNETLGAACGRIHPIGEGPMVWYQMFEYAIGHWLQKATEHMIGCVLCSPGCFSLFRGRALMDDGVMKRYTFTPKEARHYVQYDQGEDRWLCTLLLQQGYRVEYSAASDAYTHCPEGFNEFYNQRRRWVPSTMANIMDLLSDSKKTIKVNDNISMPYVAYQALLMGGSILGPGTIFLMLVGAFVAAFDIDNWTSFYYNSIPILIYMFVCAMFKSKIQLFVAMVISAVYGLVMMAVLVGIMLQIQQDGPLAPSSLFFFVIAGQMVITALLHPQEINCLPAGVVYYVTVPSMYLLLIVYSIFNLDNISWGTRETPQVQETKTKKEIEEEKKLAEEAKKKGKGNSIISFLQGVGSKNDSEEGSLEFSMAGLFKCIFCTHPKSVDDKLQLVRIGETLEALSKKLDVMERRLDPVGGGARRRTLTSVNGHMGTVVEDPEDDHTEDEESTHSSSTYEVKLERDELINPYWIEDRDLKGPVDFLKDPEIHFWKDLIGKYLYPIEENKDEQARITKELKRLRNKSVFAFFMLNALFVLVVFLLQLKKDFLHINWPMGVKMDIRFNSTSNEIYIVKTYLSLEPVGMVFVIFFAVIMVIQFVAMLLHRFGTLSHILATTSLSFGCGKKKIGNIGNKVDDNAVKTAIQMQKINNINGDLDATQRKVEARKTIYKLEDKANNRRPTVNNLDEGFRKTLHMVVEKGADSTIGRRLTVSRDTVQKLVARRTTVLDRRKSQKRSISSSNDNSTLGHKSVKFSDEQHNVGFDDNETAVSMLY